MTIAATLAVTASLQWICGLSLAWLVARAATDNLGTRGVEGGVYHLFNRIHERMLDGLAVPLYLFPLASFITGFLVLAPRPWARVTHTVVGLTALGWSAWWLWGDLAWWLVPAAYVGVACLLVWTPAASGWYRQSRELSPG